jgi:beta-lactamase class A
VTAGVVCVCVLIVALAVARQRASGTGGPDVGEAPQVASASPSRSATTAPPAAARPSSSARPTPTVDAEDLAASASTRVVASLPSGSVSVAATNLDTGQSFTFGATRGMVTASVVKLDLLEVLLLQHQHAGTTLAADEAADAVAMIEHSDNSAAESVFETIGGRDALDEANPKLGVSTATTVPGPSDYWGLTTTSADDQVALVRNLAGAGSPLSAAARSYALDLLRDVESDQTWGAPVAADPGSAVAVKNGWLDVDDDGGRWAVNSDALITVGGDLVAISVLTQHNEDEQAGINLVESLSQIAAKALG